MPEPAVPLEVRRAVHRKPILDRLNVEVNRALRDPDMIAKLAAQGVHPEGGTAADFQWLIATEIRNWTETARAANIKAE